MNFSQLLPFFLALAAGHFFLPLLVLLVRSTLVEVEDEHAVLITSFGRLTETLRTPGAHFRPSRLLPWVKTTSVSLARDFRVFTNVHVNDTRGTTVLVDLWVELRVVDPVRALFAVDDWDHSVQNLVTYAATSILGGRDFQAILHDRNALGEALLREIRGETERWGISVDRAFIRNVSLLPEVARLLFGTIAARIERAKATVEEQGQIEVARLEADTARQCAGFVAEAKAQYPLAVGRGLASLKTDAPVYDAYRRLFALAQLHPTRTVSFLGFDQDALRAIDAAMLPASAEAMQAPVRAGRAELTPSPAGPAPPGNFRLRLPSEPRLPVTMARRGCR